MVVHDGDDSLLPECFCFHGIVMPDRLVAVIRLLDDREAALGDLFSRDREPRPVQWIDKVFKNASRVPLDLTALMVPVAEIEDALAFGERRGDLGMEMAARLSVGRCDGDEILGSEFL